MQEILRTDARVSFPKPFQTCCCRLTKWSWKRRHKISCFEHISSFLLHLMRVFGKERTKKSSSTFCLLTLGPLSSYFWEGAFKTSGGLLGSVESWFLSDSLSGNHECLFFLPMVCLRLTQKKSGSFCTRYSASERTTTLEIELPLLCIGCFSWWFCGSSGCMSSNFL